MVSCFCKAWVLVHIPVAGIKNKEFVYLNTLNATAGDIIEVPFGKRQNIPALCVEVLNNGERLEVELDKIKPITSIIQKNCCNNSTIEFLKRVMSYYMMDINALLEMVLVPPLVSEKNKFFNTRFSFNDNIQEQDSINDANTALLAKDDFGGTKKNGNAEDNNLKKNLASIAKTKPAIKKLQLLVDTLISNNSMLGWDLLKIGNVKQIKALLNANIIKKTENIYSDLNVASANNENKANHGSLNTEQLNAYNHIAGIFGIGKTTLVYGVTGCGKTEIYCKAIEALIQKDPTSQVLILLPEIAMVSSLTKHLEKMFKDYDVYENKGNAKLIWHSTVGDLAKQNNIYAITHGLVNIIIGARSAIMLPYKNLQLIVVDEEHDSSYKQDSSPTYNARDIAVLRGHTCSIPVVLCSATPSVESYKNAQSGKYDLVKVRNRFGGNIMPKIQIVDSSREEIRKDGSVNVFTDLAIAKLQNTIIMGHQALVFLNRRGYSRILACKDCKTAYCCPNCDNKLVYHKKSESGKCHYCLHSIDSTHKCIKCGKMVEPIGLGGYGIERVVEELNKIFPNAKVVTVSSDTMFNQEAAKEIINKIANKEVDIIVGTQISAKGYNFEHLKLVIALNIDIDGLTGDVRIFEKTYQLLVQVAGRAGRFGKSGGEVVIQTRNPNNPVIQSIISGIEDHFYFEELNRRKLGNLPPYTTQTAVIASADKQTDAQNYIELLANEITKLIPKNSGILIFGPAENVIHKMQKKYRYHILLQGYKQSQLSEVINRAIIAVQSKVIKCEVVIKIDVNPNGII